MKALLVLLALAAIPAQAATLVEVVGRGDPAELVDHIVALGQRIDLGDPAQVAAAIGDVRGLPARRATTSAFAAYTAPGGEIIFNPDLPGRTILLVSTRACLPRAVLQQRLHGPLFAPAAGRIRVLMYSDVAYRDRPGTALTYPDADGRCVGSLGIAQRKIGA